MPGVPSGNPSIGGASVASNGGVNGGNSSAAPVSGQSGWTLHGSGEISNGQLVLREDPRVFSGFSRSFTIEPATGKLQFTSTSADFGPNGALNPPDAFEIALLDLRTMQPLAGTAMGLTQTDALLNLQPDGSLFFSPFVNVSGASASGQRMIFDHPVTVTVDVSGVAPGTPALLSFDLLGFGPATSSVSIRLASEVVLPPPPPPPPPPIPIGPGEGGEDDSPAGPGGRRRRGSFVLSPDFESTRLAGLEAALLAESDSAAGSGSGRGVTRIPVDGGGDEGSDDFWQWLIEPDLRPASNPEGLVQGGNNSWSATETAPDTDANGVGHGARLEKTRQRDAAAARQAVDTAFAERGKSAEIVLFPDLMASTAALDSPAHGLETVPQRGETMPLRGGSVRADLGLAWIGLAAALQSQERRVARGEKRRRVRA